MNRSPSRSLLCIEALRKALCGEKTFRRTAMDRSPLEGLIIIEDLWVIFYG